MPYTKNSENLIDYFLNDMSLFLKKRTIKQQKKTDNILKMLHKDILITDRYVNFLQKKIKLVLK